MNQPGPLFRGIGEQLQSHQRRRQPGRVVQPSMSVGSSWTNPENPASAAATQMAACCVCVSFPSRQREIGNRHRGIVALRATPTLDSPPLEAAVHRCRTATRRMQLSFWKRWLEQNTRCATWMTNILAMGQMVDEIPRHNPAHVWWCSGEDRLAFTTNQAHRASYKRAVAQPIPGPATDALGMIARRRITWRRNGQELRGDTMYNAGVAIDPPGQVIGGTTKGMLIDWGQGVGIHRTHRSHSGTDRRYSDRNPHLRGIEQRTADPGLRRCAAEMMLSLQASFEPGPSRCGHDGATAERLDVVCQSRGEEGDVTHPGTRVHIGSGGQYRCRGRCRRRVITTRIGIVR